MQKTLREILSISLAVSPAVILLLLLLLLLGSVLTPLTGNNAHELREYVVVVLRF
jgi:hypothetical protein